MQKTLRTGERARDSDATTLRSARTWTPGVRSAPPLQTLLALPATLLGAYATRKQTIACSQMQGSTHQLGLAQRMDLLSNGGWWGGGMGKESDTMGFKGFNRHVE